MEFIHLADLHIGKTLNGYSLLEDQAYVLEQVVDFAKEKHPDAIILAGDIYDKSVPSVAAVSTFNAFLEKVDAIFPSIPLLIIAGNHDAGERLDFASSILEKHALHIVGMPPMEAREYIKKVVLEDAYGEVNFYLLPFIKPAHVQKLYKQADREIGTDDVHTSILCTYDTAFQFILQREEIDFSKRNVLLSHQFFVGRDSTRPLTSDSEILHVGGVDEISTDYIKDFDYVALGHIHRPQQISFPHIRYAGSILKYSISEIAQTKGFLYIKMGEKGKNLEIEQIPLIPKRELKVYKGRLEEILSRADKKDKEAYVSITLTDEEAHVNVKDRLGQVYPYLLEIRIENERTKRVLDTFTECESELINPIDAWENFFYYLSGRHMKEEEKEAIEKAWHICMEEV